MGLMHTLYMVAGLVALVFLLWATHVSGQENRGKPDNLNPHARPWSAVLSVS